MLVYVGTFTGDTGAEGISVLDLDLSSGTLSHVQTVPGLISPSFLALHPTGRFLYAVERQWSTERTDVGAVSAFAVDRATGHLAPVNRKPSGGVSPAHVSVHSSGRFVFAAHYASGQVAVLPVSDDGRLADPSHVVQHDGRGPAPARQDGPHAHFVLPDPSGRLVFVCDLGIDRVQIYRLDQASGRLAPAAHPYAQVSSGAGPRHLAFHPSGHLAYVINELDSTISAFALDQGRGALSIIQTVSTLPDGFAGTSHTAHILVHRSGRFVYGSNRGHDSIAIFAVDPDSGRLSLVGHEPSGGRTPRTFTVDPAGDLLLAANQGSGTIVTFRIDGMSGRLTPTGHAFETPSPVCLVCASDRAG